jgi:nitroreductase
VTDHPIHPLLAARRSVVAFDARPVPDADLRSLFEAARWAPSSRNEQPWSYVVARCDEADRFGELLACLTAPNQVWAAHAGALAIAVAHTRFAASDEVNFYARHDLALATANLTVEALSRGLDVHQMAGILADEARERLEIPAGYEAVTALAIGYRGSAAHLPERLQQRERVRRPRKPQAEFVFSGRWGTPRP